MHVAEDGLTFSYRPAAGKRRVIKRDDIECLFVRIFFFHSILFYLFFCSPSGCQWLNSIDVHNCSIFCSAMKRLTITPTLQTFKSVTDNLKVL
jgi:hypothetical protein